MQYESSVDTGQLTLGSNGGMSLIHLDVPIVFEEFMNENCATWMYNDVELQSPEFNACEYHVVAFCLSRINNMSHYDYISMFSDN